MAVCIIVIIILSCTFAFALYRRNNEIESRRKIINNGLDSLTDFEPTDKIIGIENRYIFAIDWKRMKIAYINETEAQIISFKEIKSVEVVENNRTLYSNSTLRTVGRSIVGGMLAGDVGAVIGGLSGNTEKKKKVSNVLVKIALRNLSSPVLTINCFDYKYTYSNEAVSVEGVFSYMYKSGLEQAQEIYDLINVIINGTRKRQTENKFK